MNNTGNFIRNIDNNNIEEYTVVVFSVFNKWLTPQEAQRTVMCYAQAVEEGRMIIFSKYQKAYIKAFNAIYKLYEKSLFIHFCLSNDEKHKTITEELHSSNIVEFFDNDDCSEGLCKPVDIKCFEEIITDNIHEKTPFKNIVFNNINIYIAFGFDLTFRIIYDKSVDLTPISNILIDSNFHILPTGKQ